MSEHTPGAWRVIGDGTEILALENTPSVLVVAATKFFEGSPTSWERANARLIAAAPEMLAALKKLRRTFGKAVDPDYGTDPLLVAADAAIAKAEGCEP